MAAVVGLAAIIRGALATVIHSAGFVKERRVLAGSCHVWAAGSPVRTVLLRLTMKNVGLQGEAAVEMGTTVEQGGRDDVVWSSSLFLREGLVGWESDDVGGWRRWRKEILSKGKRRLVFGLWFEGKWRLTREMWPAIFL
ncbi:hypothetical protein NC653_009769 [Populus alba x Populus x berolinensis]|uniref:Uncharacterized protein n=1 Tax=Populus alba x Populus x berolinensis TaxID=444605 RepID=A0AAD6RA22_9ROSI|nr:hypothetical protein NC653_009769 [Populus alba x Populus x berolinensis]